MKHIKPCDLNENTFKLLGKDWALLASCDNKHEKSCNAMTVSWGTTGVLWGKDVFFCFVRPGRYTKEFIDNSENITLSFFDEQYRNALSLCGKVSGRDTDKLKDAGLTHIITQENYVTFEQARLTIVGKKLYEDTIKPHCFSDKELISKWYPQSDFHTVYVCEITDILAK